MNANEIADAMEIRASIRRQATSRKSVQECANDRLADQLEQAATMLRQQQAEIERLNQRIEFMVENQSHHEGIAHASGFEAGWQSAQAEIEALKEALRMKVILNTHVEKAMRETK